MQGLGADLRHAKHLVIGQHEGEFRGRLGPACYLEAKAHTVDDALFPRFANKFGRFDKSARAFRRALADAAIDRALGALFKHQTELIDRPALKMGPAHDRLRRGVRHELDRGVDRHAVAGTDHALQPAEVIGMGVGDENRADRSFAQCIVHHFQRRGRGLLRHQRVDENPAPIAPDHGHIGVIEPARLPDAIRHLEQPAMGVEPPHAPQRGVHRRRAVALQKIIGRHVPGHAAHGVHDRRIRQVGDPATRRRFEIAAVTQRQARGDGLVRPLGGGHHHALKSAEVGHGRYPRSCAATLRQNWPAKKGAMVSRGLVCVLRALSPPPGLLPICTDSDQ